MELKVNNFEKVWEVVKHIPKGKVTTYGAIADFLVMKSPRMIGWALHMKAVDLDIPAHRVVNRKGVLTGKNQFPTPYWMEEMLISEGVMIEDDQVLNFEQTFIHPIDFMDWDLNDFAVRS